MIGVIYKISNSIDDRIYVGSTFRSINERFSGHGTCSRLENGRNYNGVLYVAMRELGFDKFRIEVIETVECDDKNGLHEREQHHIEDLNPIFNRQRAYHTVETKEKWRKEYEINRILNKTEEEQIETAARVKRWQNDNKEHVIAYKQQHYLDNKAEIREKQTAYYQANKETIKANAKKHALATPKVSITCSCGGSYRIGQKNRHFKTKKHIDYINVPTEEEKKIEDDLAAANEAIRVQKQKEVKKDWHIKHNATMTDDDKKAKSLKTKEWVAKNSEKSKAYFKARYEANKVETAIKDKARYEANKAEIAIKRKARYEAMKFGNK